MKKCVLVMFYISQGGNKERKTKVYHTTVLFLIYLSYN